MTSTTPRENHRDGDRPTERPRASMVPWFPDYLLLEGSAALIVVAVLCLVALLVDAPLLAIADPDVTPDPSKAPWYFVGLQELLHYYPPVVAGAVVPALTVALLVAAPFLSREALWPPGVPRSRRIRSMFFAVGLLLAAEILPAQHVPWLLVVPTAAMGAAMLAPALFSGGIADRLARLSLAAWIALWLGLCAVGLTVAGALFRGPGWAWCLPWAGGGF